MAADYHQSTRKSNDIYFFACFLSWLAPWLVCENLNVIQTTRKPSIILVFRDEHKSIVERISSKLLQYYQTVKMKMQSIKMIEINVWKIMNRIQWIYQNNCMHLPTKLKRTYVYFSKPQDTTKKINKRYFIDSEWVLWNEIKMKREREKEWEKKESISCVIQSHQQWYKF